MQHVSAEEITDYFQNPTGETGRRVEGHLTSCPDCASLIDDFRHLVTFLQSDSRFEPPADLVRTALGFFQPLVRLPKEGRLRRIIASLVFDTVDQPLPAGVRHAGVAPRQLLFRAGDVDVDVKIESFESQGKISLLGQVLSKGEKFFDNTPVKLESHGEVRYTTRTNAVGEFSFEELPTDTYHLLVELPEGQVTMFCVHRGNA
jgi:hypothetical protein